MILRSFISSFTPTYKIYDAQLNLVVDKVALLQ